MALPWLEGEGGASGREGTRARENREDWGVRERRGETKPSCIPRAQHWQPNERIVRNVRKYKNLQISNEMKREEATTKWNNI